MMDPSEGGNDGLTDVSVNGSRAAGFVQDFYDNSRGMFDGYFGWFAAPIRNSLVGILQTTSFYSGRDVAGKLRWLSSLLGSMSVSLRWWFGHTPTEETEQMQATHNDKLWTHNENGSLNHIRSDELAPLFPEGRESEWPNLILTSNHARAGRTGDLSELMLGFEKVAEQAWGRRLDLCRLTQKMPPEQARGKTIMVLACHTEKDILLNGATLIERRRNLEEDPNKEDPARRTMAGVSPAAKRLAKLMLKLMIEPPKGQAFQDFRLVDLDLEHMTSREHDVPIVLRQDAASIAQHIKLIGYSKGANTVTDALRCLYQELALLHENQLLFVRQTNGKVRLAAEDEEINPGEKVNDIRPLIRNIGLASLAPGEVPLTMEEKHKVGINRFTILNKYDVTAGHMVRPDDEKGRYDRWSDRLMIIEGDRKESGHGIKSALGSVGIKGDDGKWIEEPCAGFIMDPANRSKPNYRHAQDELRAFFASNYQVQAITTPCFSVEGVDNVLYLQLAPGAVKADAKALADSIVSALRRHGIAALGAETDLSQRRRVRVLLDHDAATSPIIRNNDANSAVVGADVGKVKRCREAFADLTTTNPSLFMTCDVDDYFTELETKTPTTVVQVGRGVSHSPAVITGKSDRYCSK